VVRRARLNWSCTRAEHDDEVQFLRLHIRSARRGSTQICHCRCARTNRRAVGPPRSTAILWRQSSRPRSAPYRFRHACLLGLEDCLQSTARAPIAAAISGLVKGGSIQRLPVVQDRPQTTLSFRVHQTIMIAEYVECPWLTGSSWARVTSSLFCPRDFYAARAKDAARIGRATSRSLPKAAYMSAVESLRELAGRRI